MVSRPNVFHRPDSPTRAYGCPSQIHASQCKSACNPEFPRGQTHWLLTIRTQAHGTLTTPNGAGREVEELLYRHAQRCHTLARRNHHPTYLPWERRHVRNLESCPRHARCLGHHTARQGPSWLSPRYGHLLFTGTSHWRSEKTTDGSPS